MSTSRPPPSRPPPSRPRRFTIGEVLAIDGGVDPVRFEQALRHVLAGTEVGLVRFVDDAAGARAVLVDALVAWSAALARAAALWPEARWRECGPSASLYRFVWKNDLQLDWSEA